MNSLKTIKELIPLDKKQDIFNKIVTEEFMNNNLINIISKEFIKKGIPTKTIMSLFSREQTLFDLNIIEQIAFITGAYEGLEWDYLKIEKWFQDDEIVQYEVYSNIEEEINVMNFHNVIKIDDYNYFGYITLKQIYEYYSNKLILYNKDTQREPVYEELGTKNHFIRKISLNQKAVNEIRDLVLNGDYEEDMIILNLLLLENIEQVLQLTDEKVIDNIYNVEIVPNYDVNSINKTICNILDGFHRFMGCFNAYSEILNNPNKYPKANKGLPFKLVLRNSEKARNIVRQSFKRTDTGKEWLETLKTDDYTKFADELINNCSVLRGKVAQTYNEYKAVDGMLTTKYLIIWITERLKIQVNNLSARVKYVKEIANTLEQLWICMADNYFDGDIEKLNNSSKFANINAFAGYITMAYFMVGIKDEFKKGIILDNICEAVNNFDSDLMYGKLKYGAEVKGYGAICDYFERLTKNIIYKIEGGENE